ncbi:hypothetical protein HDU99_007251 [Rhizoclosmatium hyalinum]|nr:hypothetical protein HDU99_007251 [Rhizoclosmatium hyalinum]
MSRELVDHRVWCFSFRATLFVAKTLKFPTKPILKPVTVITMKSAIFLLAAASLGFCQNVSGVNGSCGGFVLNPNVCATGLVCVRRTNLPDVGGTCQYPTTVDATADATADATGVVGTIDVATDTQAVVATVDATTTAPAAAATSATTSSAAAKATSTATSTTKAASFGTSASLSMAAAMITFLMA